MKLAEIPGASIIIDDSEIENATLIEFESLPDIVSEIEISDATKILKSSAPDPESDWLIDAEIVIASEPEAFAASVSVAVIPLTSTTRPLSVIVIKTPAEIKSLNAPFSARDKSTSAINESVRVEVSVNAIDEAI